VPVIALVQGGCFGGGTGIVAACDIVIVADNAIFSIAEVRWGLHASIIFPQLADAIGVRQLRRYALTGERFGADEAVRIGLAHKAVALAELEAEGARMVEHVLANGPQAISETKEWVLRSAWQDLGKKDFTEIVDSHAKKRQSAEAAEGLASFAEKRAGRWA
jgi:methylglutaconyl-CoA hydratase